MKITVFRPLNCVEIVHVTEEAIEVSETENIAMVVDVAQTAQVADEAEPQLVSETL